jgi:hypothetical protein
MNRLLSAIVLAAASTAASWAMQRWLSSRAAPAKPPKQLENWENEGGALAPQQAAVETSQVPR